MKMLTSAHWQIRLRDGQTQSDNKDPQDTPSWGSCHVRASSARVRAIKSSTLRNYLGTLDSLGLSDVPASDVTLAMLTDRLDNVLTPSTRRKHIINLRATLGVPLKCPRAEQTLYDLPDVDAVKDALDGSRYRFYGLLMLYAGLRIGEACTAQPLQGNVLTVNRQRRADGSIARAKTEGPVIIPEWLASEYKNHRFEHANNTVYIGIVRAGRKHGLTIKPHMLRHLYATELVRHGASPEVLRRQMRHHDVTVSLRYYVQTTQRDVESVVRNFD